jgi:Flp pilus assembly protein TadG
MSLLLRPVGAFGPDRAGSAAVEFGLTAPVFFLLLFGAIEFARLLWTQNSLQYAVEEAARCGAVNPAVCPDNTATTTFASSQVYGIEINPSAFTVSDLGCGVQVNVSLPFSFFAIFPAFTLTGQACRPKP